MRRRTQFALLRTLGLSRGRLTLLLMGEGALVGVIGALLGLAAGYALADVVLRVFGADLGAGFFRGVAPRVAFDPAGAATYGALGIGVAVLGSFVPAREAARAMPAAALKAGDEQRAFTRLRSPWPGLALLGDGRRRHAAAADRRPAAVRLRRDRAAAARHAAAAAAHRRAGARARAGAACVSPARWRSRNCAARRARRA